MERRQDYWDRVYTDKPSTGCSWYEPCPTLSLDLIMEAAPGKGPVIDIGGGASFLPDRLLDAGFAEVTSLDLSAVALSGVARRLAPFGTRHHVIVADVTAWSPDRHYMVWHDRAALHFLTEAADQARYVAALRSALLPGGITVIGGFSPDGPLRCSGLPVMRHDSASLCALLGNDFTLLRTVDHLHETPNGTIQAFQFSVFSRKHER
ncbi:class I SAM-dependent methyltransferase [Asaia bogorensis]|uniref:class I SAM-dependent methyltransferase n=1 Tax=Asaia bogorensis TaxID=91915 RepID=UPI0030197731